MTRPLRLALLSALALIAISASAVHLLQPRLALPPALAARPSPRHVVVIGGHSIPAVSLAPRETAAVEAVLRAGVAVTTIGEAEQQQAEFGAVAHFLSLETLDGPLVLGVPAHPPITADACQDPLASGYFVRINGTLVTESTRYAEWWLLIAGSVAMTRSASTFAQLVRGGAAAIPCTQYGAFTGVLHIDGLDIQTPSILPAEVDALHRIIAAGLQPTEADRLSSPSGLFVHLRSGAVVLAGSCDDVRSEARTTHLVGGGDPFAPDFLAVGRLGDMAVGTNDRAVWESLGAATQPCF